MTKLNGGMSIPKILCGTMDAIVDRLTHDHVLDVQSIDTFLMTYITLKKPD